MYYGCTTMSSAYANMQFYTKCAVHNTVSNIEHRYFLVKYFECTAFLFYTLEI